MPDVSRVHGMSGSLSVNVKLTSNVSHVHGKTITCLNIPLTSAVVRHNHLSVIGGYVRPALNKWTSRNYHVEYFDHIKISNMYGSDVYDFSVDDDWALWGGSKRSFSDVMYLAFSNAVSSLSMSNALCHYRFGTFHNTNDNSGNNRNALFSGTVEYIQEGIKANAGVVRTGGQPADYHFIYENNQNGPIPPDPSGVVSSFVFGAWIKWNGSSPIGYDYQNLLGYNYAYWDPNVGENYNWDTGEIWYGSFTDGALGLIQLMGNLGDGNQGLSISFGMDQYAGMYGTSWQSQVSIGNDLVVGQWYFLLVHCFYTRDNSNTKRAFTRVFVNGKLTDEVNSEDQYSPASYGYTYVDTSAMRYWPKDSYTPGLLAMSRSNGGTGQETYYYSSKPAWIQDGWGNLERIGSFQGSADELFIAQGHPFKDQNNNPLTGKLALGPVGTQVFIPHRHPNPETVGYTSTQFVCYSPVINSGKAFNSGITSVLVNYGLPLSGGRVDVSIRASTTSFTATNSSIQWSSWFNALNGIERVTGGGGLGPYVQVRLRIIPSSDSMNMESPSITKVQLYVGTPGNGEGNLDILAQIQLGPYLDIPAQTLIRQVGSLDIPAKFKVKFAGIPIDIPAQVNIYYNDRGSIDIPAQVYIKGTLYIPAQATIHTIVAGSIDIPAQVNVLRLMIDIPAQVFIKGRLEVPAQANILAFTVPAQVMIRYRGNIFIPAKVNIPPDVPSAVNNLQCNIPAATWQTNPNVVFTWEASTVKNIPVDAYYWEMLRSPNMPAQMTWNRTLAMNAEIDLSGNDYGSGIWYFIVAARNTAGYFGQPTVYQINYDNPPSAPGTTFMRINGQDSLFDIPLIGYRPSSPSRFSWNQAEDTDVNDTVSYTVEFATQDDFGINLANNQTSIISTYPNLPTNQMDLITPPTPGRYFWRVKASDGKQESPYGKIGTFVVNAPPGAPVGLAVLESD